MIKGKKFTLTGLVHYCNNEYGIKKGGKPFTVSDVKGYTRRGRLPKFAGGQKLIKLTQEDLGALNSTVPLYVIK